jgi:hypothetical protein
MSRNVSKNFTIDEFKSVPDVRLVFTLQNKRNTLGKSLTIQSNSYLTAGCYSTEQCLEVAVPNPDQNLIPVYGKNFQHDLTIMDKEFTSYPVGVKSCIIAIMQIGFHEGNNNENPFGAYFKMNNLPWCSMFVHWCWKMAGMFDNKNPKYPFASSRQSYSNLDVKRALENSCTGDGIFWGMKSDSVAGHTGMIVYNDRAKYQIYTVEGNSGDSVSLRKYSYGNAMESATRKLLGIASPAHFLDNVNLIDKSQKIFEINDSTR